MSKTFIKIFILCLPGYLWANEASFQKDWTGLYVGGNVGGIFNRAAIESNHIAFSNLDGQCNQKNYFSSAFIGPQAGLIKQLDSNLVLGVEGDFTYNFSQTTQARCDCEFYPNIYDQFNLTNRNQGSIRGRLGYALQHNILPYFTAGGSFANMGLKYTNEAGENYTINNIQYGFMVGGGLEYAYSAKLSVRLEYYYYVFKYSKCLWNF